MSGFTTPTGGRSPGRATHAGNLSQDAQERLIRNWAKDIGELPVFKDLPRLIRGIQLLDASGHVIYEDDPNITRKHVLLGFMKKLAEHICEPEEAALLNREILTCFDTSVDDDMQLEPSQKTFFVTPAQLYTRAPPSLLKKFFSGTAIPRDSRLFKVLKCIQQEIVVVPVLELRKVLYENHPYKDTVKSWKVTVELQEDACVIVHKKQEQAHSPDPQDIFGFEWSFEMRFPKKMSSFSPRLFIVDWWFHEQLRPEAKVDLERLFAYFIKPTTPFVKAMNRSFEESNITPHIVKLAETASILDWKRRNMFTPDVTAGKAENMWQFLLDLTTQLGDFHIMEPIISRCSASGDPKVLNRIKHFFLEADKVDCRSARVIKSFHPDVVHVGAMKLLDAMKGRFSFDDMRDDWRVAVQVSQNSVHVIHTNKSVGKPNLEFSWRLELKFNREVKNLDFSIQVLSYNFRGSVGSDVVTEFKKCIEPYITEEIHYSKILSKDFSEFQPHLLLPKLAPNTSIFVGDICALKAHGASADDECPFKVLNILATYLDPGWAKVVAEAQASRLSPPPCVTGVEPRSDLAPSMRSVGVRTTVSASHPRSDSSLSSQSLPVIPTSQYTPMLDTTLSVRERIRSLFLRPNFDETCLARVMKAIDRQLLVPALLKLRENLHGSFPYKAKDYWALYIYIDDVGIKIIHEKVEVSSEPEAPFELTWRLQLRFDREMQELIQANVFIHDWDVPTTATTEFKHSFHNTIAPFVSDYVPYRRVWRQPLLHGSVGAEVCGSAKVIKIYDAENKKIYVPNLNQSKSQMAYSYLSVLFDKLVKPRRAAELKKRLGTALEGKSDPTGALDSFFKSIVEEKLVREDGSTIKVLKTLSQGILTPAMLKLRKEYYEQFPYKPIKGSWKIKLHFVPKRKKVIVVHKKQEQSLKEDTVGYFTFEWEARIALNYGRDKLKVHVRINELHFHQQAHGMAKAQVVTAFQNLVKDSAEAFSSSVKSLPALEILSIVMQSIQKIPDPPSLDQTRQELQGQTLMSLLTQLERTLSGVQLPQVMLAPQSAKRKSSDSEEMRQVAKATSISGSIGETAKNREDAPMRSRSRSGGAASKSEIKLPAPPKRVHSPVDT